MTNYILSKFKWYRKRTGGKWYHLYHKGIQCSGWFNNPKYISSQEHIDVLEDYTTVKEMRKRKLKKIMKKNWI